MKRRGKFCVNDACIDPSHDDVFKLPGPRGQRVIMQIQILCNFPDFHWTQSLKASGDSVWRNESVHVLVRNHLQQTHRRDRWRALGTPA